MNLNLASQTSLPDYYIQHMSCEFSKMTRKIGKLAKKWERATILGDLAEIPVDLYERVMNDVYATFLVYRAALNGVQASLYAPKDDDE
jgi:hypothetical protein